MIVITGYGTIESAVQAIKQGAYDYLTKPIIDDELRLAIERAIKQQSLMSENITSAHPIGTEIQPRQYPQPGLQDGQNFRSDRGRRRQQNNRADDRPFRHRQEHDRTSDPLSLVPQRKTVCRGQLRRTCRKHFWKANCSAM